MKPETERVQEIPTWTLLCSLVVIGIYAFSLSIIGGVVLWASLNVGATYEMGILLVSLLYGFEIYRVIKEKLSPAALMTNAVVYVMRLVLVRPAATFCSGTSFEIRGDIAWLLMQLRQRVGASTIS